MPIKALRNDLDARGVRYITLKHSLACTAQKVAVHAHISGHHLATAVMVDIEDHLATAELLVSRLVKTFVWRGQMVNDLLGQT